MGIVCTAILGGWLVGHLDPNYKKDKKEYERDRRIHEAYESSVAQAIPEAGNLPSGAKIISFSDLSYSIPVEKAADAKKTGYNTWMPKDIKSLDGKIVRLEGYMLPTKTGKDGVEEALILANQQACCYGQTPLFCEFVVAKMTGDQKVPGLQDRPLYFTGKISVGDTFTDGTWSGIYHMEVTSVGR